ncbi:glutathione S-transferase [Polychytrium aggregatum]|uniref:glutathione S-transferase n=1 Tax=Polychytrium aggregatum TaxID=110093 RepID=UPI0022FF369C|nr:glutathione S-transferase [Polychytrium aggregatum]KAI9203834.1 glutathione S-transferase [Polychytrium aggregatum]
MRPLLSALHRPTIRHFPSRVFAATMSTSATAAKADAALYKWASNDGEFRRQVSSFRSAVQRDSQQYPVEKDRYHVYISKACPWASSVYMTILLLGLTDSITITTVDPVMPKDGWFFSNFPGSDLDPIFNAENLRQIYHTVLPDYQGRYTVPIFLDKATKTIVSNESIEIIKFLNSEFGALRVNPSVDDLYPESLRAEIDEMNQFIYDNINNGVYKTGFATAQAVYENHCKNLFESLDKVEAILSSQEFLVGGRFTLVDLRLFVTIIRFDPVYHGHFKCNLKLIEKSYPNIVRWARQIYQTYPVIDKSIDMVHIKAHYYKSHIQINPNQIVPLNNGMDLTVPYK